MSNRILIQHFLTACALGVFALCTCGCEPLQVPQRETSGMGVIRFRDELPTKAFVESTASSLRAEGFAVAAVRSDGAVAFNENASWDEEESGYFTENDYYWPAHKSLSFAAVYPAGMGIRIDSGKNMKMDYTADGETDVICAYAGGCRPVGDAPVQSLTFRHVLAGYDIQARGTNADLIWEVLSLSVSSPGSGTYDFASDSWTRGASAGRSYFSGKKDCVTDYVSYGTDRQVCLPGAVTVTAKYNIYDREKRNLLATYTRNATVTLSQGNVNHIYLTLPFSDEKKIDFSVEIAPWGEKSHTGVLFSERLPLPGVFTVNGSGKKVKFSPGNLYWNGSEFKLENNQYDYPATRTASHISHFYWSKEARVARAEVYDDPSASDTDIFFAADGKLMSGWTVLTSDEWQYLFDNSMPLKEVVSIAGVNCFVLVPDGYAGSVASSYTTVQWAAAQSEGLVALPCAGQWYNDTYKSQETLVIIWTTSKGATNAYDMYISIGSGELKLKALDYSMRYRGYCVRLVTVL